MQPKLLCGMSLSLYHSSLNVRLSETSSSGDEGGVFLPVSNTEPMPNARRLISKSPRNLQISYGYPHDMIEKGRVPGATASTSLIHKLIQLNK